MQIDTESLTAIYGLFSGLFGSAMGVGVMKKTVERVEKDVDQLQAKFVSHELFEATLDPVTEDIREIKQDLKEILKSLKANHDA